MTPLPVVAIPDESLPTVLPPATIEGFAELLDTCLAAVAALGAPASAAPEPATATPDTPAPVTPAEAFFPVMTRPAGGTLVLMVPLAAQPKSGEADKKEEAELEVPAPGSPVPVAVRFLEALGPEAPPPETQPEEGWHPVLELPALGRERPELETASAMEIPPGAVESSRHRRRPRPPPKRNPTARTLNPATVYGPVNKSNSRRRLPRLPNLCRCPRDWPASSSGPAQW